MKVLAIGAGFGGLAAAIRLRAMGHDVTLVEKRDKPGGRAYVFERDGFVFDAGPTIVTAPHLVHELFALCGRRADDYVTLLPLDPFYRVRFDDGSMLAWSGREAEVERQIDALNPGDGRGYRAFAAAARRIFEEAMPLIDRPVESLADMFRLAPALIRTGAWRSVAALAGKHVRDPRVRQALSFHPLLIGGHPFHAPAIYALIPELEKRWGVWHVKGGTGALVTALATLFVEIGGMLRCDCEVDEILVDSTRRSAAGVRLTGGERLPADAVVSNADVAWTRSHLIPARYRTSRALTRLVPEHPGMSAFILYFGTDRRYSELGHHEILLGPRYRGLLDDVFRRGRLSPDFSLYVHHPTVTDPSLAPAGCDAWYALAPVPNLSAGIDWSAEGPALRDRIVRHLESRYLPGLSRHIVTEFALDPRYFRDALASPVGAAFPLEPVLTQSAWFRPHAASRELANLYVVGAGTHPGAGIPGVLSSARIVAGLIADKFGEVRHTPARTFSAAESS